MLWAELELEQAQAQGLEQAQAQGLEQAQAQGLALVWEQGLGPAQALAQECPRRHSL